MPDGGAPHGGPVVTTSARPRAVVLDLDGTLVDSLADVAAALDVALEQAGMPPADVDRVAAALGHGAAALVEQVTGSDDPALLDAYLAAYAEHPAERSRPFVDAVQALAALQDAGVRIGVCTNKSTALSHTVLEATGLAEHVDVVLGRDAVPHPKPDARHLEAVVAALGDDLTLDDVTYVGDTSVDVDLAHAAGVRYLHVAWGSPVADVPTIDTFLAILEPHETDRHETTGENA